MGPCKKCGNILCVCNKPPKAEFLGKPPQPPTATLRDQFAMSIIAGFAGNNAIFAADDMTGWRLVNITEEELCRSAYGMADIMLEVRGEQP